MNFSERFTEDAVFILIAMIVAAILGWLLNWWGSKSRIASLEDKLASLNREHANCSSKLSDTERKLKECEARKSRPAAVATPVVSASPKVNFDADAAKAVFGKKIKLDDLKIVEGIGPKIEGIFNADGIKTWRQLADAAPSKLKSLLDAAGPRYQMHDPTTWPKQAEMAFDGKWKELLAYQDRLDGGKE